MFSRIVLLFFGIAAIAAGVAALLGLRDLGSQTTNLLVGIGAIGGGIALLRTARGSGASTSTGIGPLRWYRDVLHTPPTVPWRSDRDQDSHP